MLTFHQWSKENGLLLEAYSPLGSNKQVKETLALPQVQNISKELGITPAQVIISWHAQRGVRRGATRQFPLVLLISLAGYRTPEERHSLARRGKLEE